jgi:hypothetical protein
MVHPSRSWGGGGVSASTGLHWEAGGVGPPSGWRTGNGGEPRNGGCPTVDITQCSIDNGHVRGTCSMDVDMQRAAWTGTCSMDTDIDMHHGHDMQHFQNNENK